MKNRILLYTLINIILISIFTGCKQTDDLNKITPVNQSNAIKVSGVYKNQMLEIPEGYIIKKTNITTGNGRIYALCTKLIETEYANTIYTNETAVLYSVDFNGENEQMLSLEHIKLFFYNGIYVLNDGSFYILCNNTIIKINADGVILNQIEPEETYAYMPFNQIMVDDDGILYINMNDAILIMAEDGGILTKIDVNIPGLELIKTPDNEIIAANVITGYNSKPNYYYIEKLNKKLIPDTDINITPPENVNENIKSYSVYYGADYDIYYRNQTGVYGYNNGDEEAILLCDWINSGIYDDYTTLISVISSQKIVCMIKDTIHVSQDSENYNAFILTKVPDDEITPKTVIKLAYTETVDKVINAVINFNLTNEQYLIILNDYSIYNSLNEYNKSVEMLNLDLINGIIPDIVLVDENMPYESYISKGMFINLYDYFDSDAEITRDNVLYGIRTAYETDGKLYCLPAKFTMDTLTVKKSAAGDKPNLTLDEMYDYYKNIPDDGSLFLSAYRESILKNCLRSGIGYFIDFKNGTCNFNGNKFIELLHFIQSYNIQETNIENLRSIGLQTDLYHIREVSIDLDGITRLREDKSYFYETSLINPESFVFLKYIFNNDEYVFKGYPTDSGNGTFINSEYLFGITDQSGCKDGAWEFIKCYLSDEIQTSVNIFSTSFPVTVSAFRHTIESLKEYNYYISSFNDQMFIIKNNKQWDETRAKGSGDILCNITDEDIDAIINFISTSRFCNNYDKKIDAIIWEELDGFFEGSGSAEQASEFIQNRVSIYLSELN